MYAHVQMQPNWLSIVAIRIVVGDNCGFAAELRGMAS